MQVYQELVKGTTTDWYHNIQRMAEILKKHKSEFDKFPEFKYVVAVSHISTLSEEEVSELREMAGLSGSWVTCACGNMCDIIPRIGGLQGGQPRDGILTRLGIDFHKHIKSINPEQALDTLNKIEERSAFLIKEIKKKQ